MITITLTDKDNNTEDLSLDVGTKLREVVEEGVVVLLNEEKCERDAELRDGDKVEVMRKAAKVKLIS